MFRDSFAVFVVSMMCAASAFAGGGNNVSNLNDKWGSGTLSSCGVHMFGESDACIGQSQKDKCDNKSMYARDYTDEWAIQMMVALRVTEQGALFCPVQIEGKNKNKGNARTEYAQLSGSCVWLCREGFTGSSCEKKVSEVASCDPTPLRRDDYSGLQRMESGANIEESVAMFQWNKYYGCGVNKGQEHDIILIITGWTESGHGAKVQQVIVRSERKGWGDMISWPNIYPANGTTEITVCKNGYKPVGDECEPIDQNLCAAVQKCSGWTGFDESIHKFVEKDGCYEFRCKGENMAFVSSSDRSCNTCDVSLRTGVLSDTGVCYTCENGKFFKDNVDEPCGDAYVFSKLDMQYGKDKGKSTLIKLKDQCWTKGSTDEYRSCVFEKVDSGTSNTGGAGNGTGTAGGGASGE